MIDLTSLIKSIGDLVVVLQNNPVGAAVIVGFALCTVAGVAVWKR